MNISDANEPQRAAITHLRGPCLVLAGPGSGKTFTITKRILYLLEQGAAPETVLVITFTREAALSMQNRFLELSGEGYGAYKPTYPVCFGTFHSVFFHILRESNLLKSDKLLSHAEKKKLLLPILKSSEKQRQIQQGGDPGLSLDLGDDAVQLLSAISYYKNTMEMSAAGRKAPARWQPDFEAIFREYEKAVKKTGRLDFDDMLYGCRRLLKENGAARSYWQNRFRYILIDEFQDINPVQYEVVKLLAAEPFNIFAVGDDDQSIYGFRGSDPECMKRFETEFGARRLLLDTNYRSRHEIVQASMAVIGENRNRFEKKLRAAEKREGESREDKVQEDKNVVAHYQTTANRKMECREVSGQSVGESANPVIICPFSHKEEQYNYILKRLPGHIQKGESCAVLFRTNSCMQGFASRMRAADIPYEMRERAVSIYEHFIVKDIMAYLQIARGEGSREQMLRIMNRPSRYISREAVGEGSADIGAVREYYERMQSPGKQSASFKSTLLRFERQLQSLKGLSLYPAVNYILKAMGYEKYLLDISKGRPEKRQEWQELLEWLKEDAAIHGSLGEWMAFQEEYSKSIGRNGIEIDGQTRAKPGGQPGAEVGGRPGTRTGSRLGTEAYGWNGTDKPRPVQLLTVHGAKGLEFDRVWIPDCNEKVFPHGRMPDESQVEEERRIFYVAMTRAKKSLELLCLTGTKERPRPPSRFLNPLYSSIISSNSQLSRYSSKASDTFSYSSSSSI